MEFTCPNCTKLYSLPDSAIGSAGRDVRCAKCAHQWHQAGTEGKKSKTSALDAVLDDDEDEYPAIADSDIPPRIQDEDDFKAKLSDDDEEEEDVIEDVVEDIPEAVKPKAETEKQKKKKDKKAKQTKEPKAKTPKVKTPRKKAPLQARITGYATAAVVLGLIMSAGFLFKKDIVNAWPPAAAIYELAGMPVMLKGEDLVLENLTATVMKDEAGENVLVLNGRVINLTNQVIAVPQMLAIMRSTNGEDGASWLIDAPVETVAPGESFVFKSDYPNMPRGVGSVNLTFVATISG